MKREQEPNKIYYDVIIDHDPGHKEHQYGVASKAETTIDLREPLIERPGDFMLSIAKFKIDTECIPLMIPEMMQPQDLTRPKVKKYNRMQTKYKIRYKFTLQRRTMIEIKNEKTGEIEQQKDKETNQWVDRLEDKTKRKDYYSEIEDYVYIMHNTHNISKDNKTKYLGFAKDASGIVTDKTKAYIDNTDPQCFVFSYDQFLIAINETLGWLTTALATTDFKDEKPYERYKDTVMYYFTFNGDKLTFRRDRKIFDARTEYVSKAQSLGTDLWVYTYYDWVITQCDVWFSPELYKYIGNGFDCIFVDSTKEPEYKGWWLSK